MKKNLLFDITDTSTTNPVDSAEIYAAALIQGGSKETFTPILDVKDKARVRKGGFGEVLQSDSCTFNDQGAGTLSEKLVDACPIKVNFAICQSTLETSFVSHEMASGSNHADFLPQDFRNYLTSELSKKMSADFEQLVWQGDVSNTGGTYPIPLCEGLIGQWTADSDVVDVSATTITSSNVIAEISSVYDVIPEAVKFSPDMKLYVSSNIMAAYRQAVAAASSEAYYDLKVAAPSFLGIPMVLSQGLPANRMAAAESTNLFLISDLMADFEDIRILPQLDVTGDDTVRVVGRVKFAVSYAYGTEIVMYS